MTRKRMLSQFTSFVAAITQYIPEGLTYTLDHIHYRPRTLEEYSQLLAELQDQGHTNLGEAKISGRMIATIQLEEPVAGIQSIELSQPKQNQTKFGLQQLGVVIDSFAQIDTSSLEFQGGNPLYPRYHQPIDLDGRFCEIKYATKTLVHVTQEEQETLH